MRWIGDQAAFLVVLAALASAFVYLVIDPGRWGRGSAVVAVAVLLAAVLRGALPTRWIGLLAVRARWVDTVSYLLLGGLILAVDIRLHH
jgi:hypothetical protein